MAELLAVLGEEAGNNWSHATGGCPQKVWWAQAMISLATSVGDNMLGPRGAKVGLELDCMSGRIRQPLSPANPL